MIIRASLNTIPNRYNIFYVIVTKALLGVMALKHIRVNIKLNISLIIGYQS
jgi:hypothetical protein